MESSLWGLRALARASEYEKKDKRILNKINRDYFLFQNTLKLTNEA